jgi:hypothetical protein
MHKPGKVIRRSVGMALIITTPARYSARIRIYLLSNAAEAKTWE